MSEIATYDTQSDGGIPNDFNLHALPLTDISCLSVQNVSFYPIAAITKTTKTIEFLIRASDYDIE